VVGTWRKTGPTRCAGLAGTATVALPFNTTAAFALIEQRCRPTSAGTRRNHGVLSDWGAHHETARRRPGRQARLPSHGDLDRGPDRGCVGAPLDMAEAAASCCPVANRSIQRAAQPRGGLSGLDAAWGEPGPAYLPADRLCAAARCSCRTRNVRLAQVLMSASSADRTACWKSSMSAR